MFLKARYVGDILVKYNIIEVQSEDLKKDVPVALRRYIINHVVEASRIKVHFNAWAAKVLKGHTRNNRRLYHVKGIIRGYRM